MKRILLTEPEFAASDLLSGEIHTDWDPGPTGRPGSARAGWRSVSAVCTAPKRPRVASTAPVPLRALPDTDEVGCSWPGTRRPRAALAATNYAWLKQYETRLVSPCGQTDGYPGRGFWRKEAAGGFPKSACSNMRTLARRGGESGRGGRGWVKAGLSEFEGSGRASGACGRGLHRPRTSPPLERPAERCGPRAGAASRPIRAEARRGL